MNLPIYSMASFLNKWRILYFLRELEKPRKNPLMLREANTMQFSWLEMADKKNNSPSWHNEH